MLSKQHLISAAVGAAAVLSVSVGAFAFAATGTATGSTATASAQTHPDPGVMGTVTAVSGNTVTVTGKDGTSYTIDASAAAITKDETVGVSAIAVGDTVAAQGTLSGTSVTATNIHDGKLPAGPMGGFGGRNPGGMGVHGTVASISGNTLTVTETNPKDNTTTSYTVDVSAATVMLAPTTAGQKPATGSVSDVKVGDTVSVIGTVSGTSVTAKSVFDGKFPMGGGMGGWGKKPASSTSGSTTSTQ